MALSQLSRHQVEQLTREVDVVQRHPRYAELLAQDLGDLRLRNQAGLHEQGPEASTILALTLQHLIELLALDDAAAIVIGLPLNMDGSEGPRAQSTRAFVRNFSNLTDLPIVFWDERLSTVAAERTLIEMDMSRKKRADRIDSAAAAHILQGALDRIYALRASAGSS